MLTGFARFPMFMNVFEPVTLLSALAGATDHIGLGGTVSTSFTEPYNVARQFASLDHISGGRAAWNVVTSANDFAARNFGHAKLAPHAERYARAREFVDVVEKLWDTWDDDAFIRDRERGLFFDPAKQHAVHHRGAHFKLDGALNIERSPQGRPVIIQAGASETGKEFAAETAEVVFASNSNDREIPRLLRRPQGPHGEIRPGPRRAENPGRLGDHPRRDRRAGARRNMPRCRRWSTPMSAGCGSAWIWKPTSRTCRWTSRSRKTASPRRPTCTRCISTTSST